MGSIINISGTFSPPTHVPDMPDGHGSDLFRAFFILNSEILSLKNKKKAGPSDGKNDKVSPIFRLPVLASLARPLMVPPYRFLPASHFFLVFQSIFRL